MLYKLQATNEHIKGLHESLAQVELTKARIEARIAGLTRVLGKR